MKPADKDAEMKRSRENYGRSLQQLLKLEWIPNASVIIESAERLGYTHLCRGSVWSELYPDDQPQSSDSKTRMQTMVSTNDGFEIAEVDLKPVVQEI
jgi:ATP-dependent DNA helicase RecG